MNPSVIAALIAVTVTIALAVIPVAVKILRRLDAIERGVQGTRALVTGIGNVMTQHVSDAHAHEHPQRLVLIDAQAAEG